MTKIIGSAALTAADPEGENLTTKGDLHGFSDENTRIPISTNNFSLLADSAQALGLKWAASPTSVLTTQSDILYASSANTLARLAKGSAGTVLTMNAGATAPEWGAAGGGQMELLDSVSLGSAGANLTLDSLDSASANYTYWVLKVAMGTEDGGESVQFRMNNKSASDDYMANIIKNTAGTLSATTSGAQSSAIICTSNIAQAASETFQFILTIAGSVQNATNTYRYSWNTQGIFEQGTAAPSDTEQSTGLLNANSEDTLTKVDFFLSGGSNFTAGSNMQLYGVKRA